jgi:hypothetical protein
MVCSECGSTFFYKVSAEQFSNAGYGSAAFRSLSTSQESVYVCLCGRVCDVNDTTGARSSIDRHAQFINALRVAINRQKKNSPQSVAEQCASLEDVSNLETRIKWLEDVVDVLANKDNNESPKPGDENLSPGTAFALDYYQDIQEKKSPEEIEQVSKPGRRKKAS